MLIQEPLDEFFGHEEAGLPEAGQRAAQVDQAPFRGHDENTKSAGLRNMQELCFVPAFGVIDQYKARVEVNGQGDGFAFTCIQSRID